MRREDAGEYANYINRTGMAEYRSTPGNQGAWMLRRDDGDHSEIITFSLWDSRDSIRAFAGEDIEQAVFYPEDDRFLIERDLVSTSLRGCGLARSSWQHHRCAVTHHSEMADQAGLQHRIKVSPWYGPVRGDASECCGECWTGSQFPACSSQR